MFTTTYSKRNGAYERKSLPKKSGGILCEGNRLEAYRFIKQHHNEFGLRWLLRRFNICPNAYYNYRKHRKADPYARRERKDRCCRKRRCGWRGKGKKERYLQIGTVQVLEQLREYKRQWEIELNRTEFFFLNRFGERYSEQAARRMVKRYAELAMINLHVTPHMFRHAFATLLLEEEVEIRFIQKMPGHASITTTQIYAEVASKKQMEILRMKHPRNRINI